MRIEKLQKLPLIICERPQIDENNCNEIFRRLIRFANLSKQYFVLCFRRVKLSVIVETKIDETTHHRRAILFPSLSCCHRELLMVQTARILYHIRTSLHSVHHLMILFVLWHSLAPLADHKLER